jgi:hypothetical protein
VELADPIGCVTVRPAASFKEAEGLVFTVPGYGSLEAAERAGRALKNAVRLAAVDIGQAIDVGKDVVHSTFNQAVVDEAAQRGVLRLPDDLVRDMTQVLTSCCARPYGRRPARNRAEKALRCMARDTGPAAPQVGP